MGDLVCLTDFLDFKERLQALFKETKGFGPVVACPVHFRGLDFGCLRDCSAMCRFLIVLDVRRTAPGWDALTAIVVFCLT